MSREVSQCDEKGGIFPSPRDPHTPFFGSMAISLISLQRLGWACVRRYFGPPYCSFPTQIVVDVRYRESRLF